jgi:hypothetical protein
MSGWERAWERFRFSDDAIEVGIASKAILDELETIEADDEAVDTGRGSNATTGAVTPLNGGEHVVVQLFVTESAFEKYMEAVQHSDDHQCEWSRTVLANLADMIVESLGEFWFGNPDA